MGWFPCSGKSTEKPPRKKKSGQQDDPFTPSSTTTSTPTSTFTSTSSSDKMKAIPSMNGKKEVNSPSNVRKEVNPPLNVKTGVNSPMRAKRDVNSPMSAKRDVNSPMSAKRDVNSPMSAKRDVNSPMSAKREVNSPASARKEVNSPFSVRKEVTPQMNMKNETYPLLDMNEMDPELNAMKEDHKDIAPAHAAVGTFTFQQLEAATKNFREDCLLGEGGFGRVYKGKMEGSNQVVAIKQLDRNGLQGNKEFLVEVLMLSLVHHPNLVNLLGYCADGDQRLLVYEYMPLGSLEDHLHDLHPSKKPLDWNARMKIAAGAAKGLEYLHDIAKPPVIYRDLKCSNILLGEEYYPKLSDFGLAKLGPIGDKTHVSTRVMGTYGYCAPEYAMTGQLTLKSDIYSFGVVLLEIITGRKAIDNSKPTAEQNLVAWARPLFKDRKKFSQMVDPKLKCMYPMRGLYQALAVAAMCVQEQSSLRPAIADVVTALSYLASQIYKPEEPSVQSTDTTLSMQRSGMAPLTPPRPKRVNTRYIKAPTNPVNLIDQCNS